MPSYAFFNHYMQHSVLWFQVTQISVEKPIQEELEQRFKLVNNRLTQLKTESEEVSCVFFFFFFLIHHEWENLYYISALYFAL